MSQYVILDLLNADNWGQYQDIIDSFKHSEYYGMFENAVENLNRDILFESFVHGVGHIERTILHGAIGAMDRQLSVDEYKLVLMACSYHDIGRIDDKPDDLHGERAAEMLTKKLTLENVLSVCPSISSQELKIIQCAIDAHSRNDNELENTLVKYGLDGDKLALNTALALKDADGLDRVRIWDLNVKFLRYAESKKYADFAQEIYIKYQDSIGEKRVPNFVKKWKHLDDFGNKLD